MSAQNIKGFTLIELLITIGVAVSLLSLSFVILLGAQKRSSITTSVGVLISDIKQQQLRAMSGDTAGLGLGVAYGVYFENARYVLFHGTQYQPNASSNFVVSLDPTFNFNNILFPNSSIVFSSVSGEVVNYDANNASVTIKEIGGLEQKILQINQYGAITIL